jgi:hypothetical protein
LRCLIHPVPAGFGNVGLDDMAFNVDRQPQHDRAFDPLGQRLLWIDGIDGLLELRWFDRFESGRRSVLSQGWHSRKDNGH